MVKFTISDMKRILVKTHAPIYLTLIITFILGDIICDNYGLQVFNTQTSVHEFFLVAGLLVLQIFASPLQAGFSDYYCRKKSLIVSLSASLISLVLVLLYSQKVLPFFFILVFISLFKGVLGNTIPLSWAALADTQQKDLRFSLAMSTGSYAIGYLFLTTFNAYLTGIQANIAAILIFAILVFLCARLFRDVRDKSKSAIRNEGTPVSFLEIYKRQKDSVLEDLKRVSTRNGLTAFLFWEVSLYSILLLLVDFENFNPGTTASMMIGYLAGVGILKFCKKVSDDTFIKIGSWISVFFLGLYFFFYPFLKDNGGMLSFCYFFYTMGNAFLCPTFLHLLSKERKPDQQGKVFGLIESADTLAFLIATVVILSYKYLQVDLIFMIGFSAVTFAISWFPYRIYQRTRDLQKS